MLYIITVHYQVKITKQEGCRSSLRSTPKQKESKIKLLTRSFSKYCPKLGNILFDLNVNEVQMYLNCIHSIYFSHFRLSYYPHRLAAFSRLLKSVFGSASPYTIYADFKPLREDPNPGFYIHAVQRVK